jgi:hypothetical protein
MKKIRAYDEYDFPDNMQPPFAQKRAPLAPSPKVKKKPGPKPKAPIVQTPSVDVSKPVDKFFLINKLVSEIRKFFTKLEIRDPKPRILKPKTPPASYISNIILDKQRIGFFEQYADSDRVFLRFEKGANIPIWHDGEEVSKLADKIKQEIESHYTKKLAAKYGYRIAIRVTASRRRLG